MSKHAQVSAVVKIGNMKRLAQLLDSHVDLNYVDEFGWTALHYGADTGHVQAVEMLLQKNINTEIRDMFGRTALHIAIQKNHLQIVKQLLQHKADGDCRDKNGRTCLHIAAGRGRVDVMEILLDHNVDIEALDNDWKTPLHWAIVSGRRDVVKYLLDQGANRSTKTKEGLDAMTLANSKGHTGIVDLLRTYTTTSHTNTHSNTMMIAQMTTPIATATSPAIDESITAAITGSDSNGGESGDMTIALQTAFTFEQTIRTFLHTKHTDHYRYLAECLIFDCYFTLFLTMTRKEGGIGGEEVWARLHVVFELLYATALQCPSSSATPCVFVYQVKYILLTIYRHHAMGSTATSLDASLQLYLEDIINTPIPSTGATEGSVLVLTEEILWLLESIGVFLYYAITTDSNGGGGGAQQTVDCKALAYYLLLRYFLSSTSPLIQPLRWKKLRAFEAYVQQLPTPTSTPATGGGSGTTERRETAVAAGSGERVLLESIKQMIT